MAQKHTSSSLTVLTANCGGNGRTETTTTCLGIQSSQPAEIRMALLQKAMRESDVVLLQQISIKRKLLKMFSDNYDVFTTSGETEVGILIKKGSFDGNSPKEVKREDYKAELDRLNDKYTLSNKPRYNLRSKQSSTVEIGLSPLRIKRFCISLGNINGISVMFVSYHGETIEDDLKKIQLKILLRLVSKVSKKEKASYVIIGGDFNLSAAKVDESQLGEEYEIKAEYEVSERRSHKELVDYFIVSKELKNLEDRSVPFAKGALEKYQKYLKGYRLNVYLDHDPVSLSVNELKERNSTRDEVAQPCSSTEDDSTAGGELFTRKKMWLIKKSS